MTSATLHTLNKNPSHTDLFEQLLHAFSPDDALVLLENGAYYLSRLKLLDQLPTQRIYVVKDDLQARGLQNIQQNHDSVLKQIDYKEFVELSCEYQKVISWY